MADNTITIVLDGEVSLSEFAQAVGHFNQLVKALSAEVGSPDLDWVLESLSVSSALASVKDPTNSEAGLKVVNTYGEVGAALEVNAPIPYSERVQSAARKVISISDTRIKAVRFETATRDAVIPVRVEGQPAPSVGVLAPQTAHLAATRAYGAVQGRIQTLSNRGGLHFTLFDLLYDKAVSCYLAEGKEEILRNLWGKLAVLEGLVTRDPINGRPLTIRQVREITPIPEPSTEMNYELAHGSAPSLNNMSPEEAIRRVRDE